MTDHARKASMLVVSVALLLAIPHTDAIQFYLDAGNSQCFTELFQGSTKVRGEYLVTAGRGEMTVSLTVRDEQRHVLFTKENIDHGNFAFSTPEHFEDYSEYDDYYSDQDAWGSRKYEICLEGKASGQADPAATGGTLKRRVGVTILKDDSAKDYSTLARDEHLSQLELSLFAMGDELNNLLQELEHVRVREDHLRKVNEATSSKVVIYSVVASLFMFAVGGYQMFYMRTYFKKKKVL